MKRRGFLRALLATGCAPAIAQVSSVIPGVAVPPVHKSEGPPLAQDQYYQSYTFKRDPGFFDIVTYTGDGIRKVLPKSSFEPSVIMIKCASYTSPWYVLESDNLPAVLNQPGEQYIAYEFGEEAVSQIRKHLANPAFIKI